MALTNPPKTINEWTFVHLHLTTKEVSMKSGSLRDNLVKEVEDTFDDLYQSAEWIKDLIKSGETADMLIEAVEQFQQRLLK